MNDCLMTIICNKIEWLKLLEIGIQGCLAWCAYQALSAWKQEYLDKKKIDLAEDIIIQMGIIRDLLQVVRNGMAYGNETDEILQELKKQKQEGVNVEINEDKLYFLVPSWRLTKNHDTINSFLKLRYKAEVYWGKPCSELFGNIEGIILQIKTACRFLYSGKDEKNLAKYSNVIWRNYLQPDEIDKQIEDIYAELKSNLEPLYIYKRSEWNKLHKEGKKDE